VIWLAAVFSEFIGPFNVLHQPLSLSAVAWGFWVVSAVAEAYALVYVLDRGRSQPAGQDASLPTGRHQLAIRSTVFGAASRTPSRGDASVHLMSDAHLPRASGKEQR
jgi:hypothetical protein